MELRFKRHEILEKLKANREIHDKVVREAQIGFRGRWLKMLGDELAKTEAGEQVSAYLHLSVPVSHLDDFDRAIEMFEMTTDDEIVLDERSFQAYVRNKWDWQRDFLVSNSAYSATAAKLSAE